MITYPVVALLRGALLGHDIGTSSARFETSEPVAVGDYLPSLVPGFGPCRVTQRRHEGGLVVLIAETYQVTMVAAPEGAKP